MFRCRLPLAVRLTLIYTITSTIVCMVRRARIVQMKWNKWQFVQIYGHGEEMKCRYATTSTFKSAFTQTQTIAHDNFTMCITGFSAGCVVCVKCHINPLEINIHPFRYFIATMRVFFFWKIMCRIAYVSCPLINTTIIKPYVFLSPRQTPNQLSDEKRWNYVKIDTREHWMYGGEINTQHTRILLKFSLIFVFGCDETDRIFKAKTSHETNEWKLFWTTKKRIFEVIGVRVQWNTYAFSKFLPTWFSIIASFMAYLKMYVRGKWG